MSGDAINASRPPLPPKPRAPNRSRKQREREVPDVDWEASLQHFAAAVSGDLDDLHVKFLQQDEVTFATWKRLWAEARMSTAFHVEFWESSPTNTHKTILQQALDALVYCIEEKDGEFENSVDVAALVGRAFALYCAYSVQLGQPKHKIDVDPRSWTALLTINCVMCGVGKTLHPTAAREVRAMMLQLVVEENAFLRCLQGFGPSVRVKEQAVKTRDTGAASGRSVSLAGDATAENDAPVQENAVEMLKSLDGRYQQLMSRARSVETSVAGAGFGGRRGKAALSAKLLSTQEAGNDAEELTRALASYMKYKSNEEARRNDRVARAAAVREDESQARPEESSTAHDDRSNILDLSDRGSVLSAPPSPLAPAAVSTGHGSHPRRNSGDSEDFLAELETELHAGVSSDVAEATAASDKRSSAFSEISEADSDALADLERELEQSAELVPSQIKEKALPARRKRGREPPATGIAPRNLAPAAASTEAPAPTFTTDSARPTIKRVRNNSVPSRLSLTRSWTATSAADSDGLADVQAELDAIPTLAAMQSITSLPRFSMLSSVVSEADSDALEDLERELNATTATLGLPAQLPIASTNGKQRPVALDKPTQRSTRSNGKQQVKGVVTGAVPAPTQPTAPTTSRRSGKQRVPSSRPAALRESPRTVSSDTESDGLAELVAELDTTVTAQTNPPVQRRQKSPVKTTKKRSTTRKQASKAVASRSVRSKAPNRSTIRATGLRRSARLSSVASDTESDGLEDLLVELESTSKTLPANSKKPKARAATTKSTVKAKPNVARTPRAPRQKRTTLKRPAARNAAVTSQPAPRVNLPSSRRSTRSSSIAFGSESDGLAELEAELQAGL
ncbi:hypothetical protein V7S43_014677 [Phytophthora oleae]|uniref:Uncharacterized protein n=1 Tax=Phytophthora oleae TaxID=2107226 RepID=A0ABD3F3S6_9STRA